MKALKFGLLAVLGVAFATAAALASGPAPDREPPAAAAPSTAAATPASPPPAPAAGPTATPGGFDPADGYRLDSGDKVKITVFNEPTLTDSFVVDGQGVISMPLIGELKVKSLTVREVQRLVESKLRDGWVRNPKVSAEMINYRPYYILGEITKPGEYPYISGLTVMKAIATAGDFTYRADKRKVFIKSVDSEAERQTELTPTTMVRPGDTIRIKERFF